MHLHDLERRVLQKDRLLQALQCLTRVDPQLVDKRAPRPLVRVERFRLSPGAVEGENELGVESLSKRILRRQGFQLRNEFVVTAEREVGLDPLLHCREPELLEPVDLDLGKRVVGELRQRGAAPETQRVANRVRCLPRPARREGSSPLRQQGLETVEVELTGPDPQHVAVGVR